MNTTVAGAVEGTFGDRLRELRERAGLTQEELAEKAGLTSYAVSALERGRRNRPYPHTVRCLVEALGASDEERAALLATIPRRSAAPTTPESAAVPVPVPAPVAAPAPAGLPTPPTRLLGREAETAALTQLLLRRENRLITLTGTGGVGKTRLATAVAAQVATAFPDGTVVVHLAPLSDAASVLPAVARAVGSSAVEGPELAHGLAEHLRPLRLLLVLDNLERLLDAAPEVVDLVAACPRLAVLVTSRAPLRVRGETEYPVSPLAVPAADGDQQAVQESAAGAVFLERAQAVSPSFELTAANAAAVAAICRRLAGIPLALELAASRVRFLDPQALLARLDDAMVRAGGRDLPARQRTMRATFDWSYDLLTGGEQQLLRLLAVFSGGCTLNAVEDAAGELGGGEDVLSLLEVLVEHSLVTVTTDEEGQPRYGLLEPVAQYAASRTLPDEQVAARAAHAAHYLAFAERAAPEYQQADQVRWLDRTEREDANLEAAMTWASSVGDGETAGRMAWSLWLYWWLRGRPASGQRLVAEALRHPMSPVVHTRAYLTKACMAFALGDVEQADAGWSAAEELAFQGEDAVARAGATAGRGLVALAAGELAAAEAHFVRSLPHAEGQGTYGHWLQSLTLVWWGTVQMVRGDHAAAAEQARRGLAMARSRGDRLTAYVALFNLAQIALAAGEHEAARTHLHEGVRLTQETRDLTNLAYFFDLLAVVEALSGDPHRVGVLVGAADAVRELTGGQVYGYYVPDEALLAQSVASARERLGADTYDDTVDAGRSLTPDEGMAYALDAAGQAPA